MLEVIGKGSGNAGPLLLFIHGAWHPHLCHYTAGRPFADR